MAQIYGNPGPEWGDQFVYEALSKLPDDLIIYPQPKLAYKRQTPRYPDYAIVYPKKGVIILEVKDWVEIIEYDRNSATIRRRDGSEATESSPVEQARAAAHLLENILKADENLVRDQGKLRFPYAYAGVLPHQPTQVIQQLEREWGEGFIFGKDDLQPEKLMKRLQEIPTPFNCRMFEHEVRIACATIKPGNKRIDRATGQFKGLIDRNQEKIAREPIAARPDASERRKREATQPALDFQEKVNIPAEVTELTTKLNVRLVRGFAGTGKTDVLILRAEFLHEQYPDSDILVTTFNDPVYANRLLPELKHLQPKVDIIKFTSLCTPIYKTRHEWRKPQSVEGVVAKLESENSLVKDFGVAFLADEFKWMKETERAKRNVYVLKIREGRGGPEGRTLGKAMKNSVFDLFEIYQGMLQKINAHDWEDIYEKTLECLRDGIEPEKKYDVILIDEAQHFAPTWVKIIKEFLKPGGTLFICDDPSQSVYRHYSWRQKGIDVVGRTRWLKIPYRNTRQIFEAAYALIDTDPMAQKLLTEDGEKSQPDLKNTALRDGPKPQVHRFSSAQDEQSFICQRVKYLIEKEGLRPEEVGVLHDKAYVLRNFRSVLPYGVQCFETKKQTGLEYRAIFIPEIEGMSERTVGLDWNEDQSRQRLKFYMTLTRAREQVYISYRQKWPGLLDPIKPYVEWIQH